MFRIRISLKSSVLLALLIIAAPWHAHAQPQRIVSINQCADEILLELATTQQIQSVTHYVKDPQISWSAALAAGIPGNQGGVEEIVGYAPDLVLVGDFNARTTVSRLREMDIEVLELKHPRSIAEIYKLIDTLAAAVGHRQRGHRLNARLRAALGAFTRQSQITAAVYQPNGYTTGADSLVDEVLQIAGLENVAARRNLRRYSYYPMELLLWDQPRLLILDPQSIESPSLAHQVLSHPALQHAYSTLHTVSVPPQAWACGSHHIVRAVALLHAAAARVRADSINGRGSTDG